MGNHRPRGQTPSGAREERLFRVGGQRSRDVSPDESEQKISDIHEILNPTVPCSGRYLEVCCVEVSYDQPVYGELQMRFGWLVHPGYQSVYFEPVDACRGIAPDRRVVKCELWEAENAVQVTDVLRMWGRERPEIRPGLYQEGLALAEVHPALQYEHVIVLPGSITEYDGVQMVACLSAQANQWPMLQLFPVEDVWIPGTVFLVVHRQPDFESPRPFSLEEMGVFCLVCLLNGQGFFIDKKQFFWDPNEESYDLLLCLLQEKNCVDSADFSPPGWRIFLARAGE